MNPEMDKANSMNNYIPPDPSVGDAVRHRNDALRAIHNRLGLLSDEELRSVLAGDPDPASRPVALGLLFSRLAKAAGRTPDTRNARLVELLGGLLNDPHPDIAKSAIRHCRLTYERHIEAVRAALDHPENRVQAEAAIALAKIKDAKIFDTLQQWFDRDEQGFRNVAIEALKTLGTDEARDTLIESYEKGGRNEGDKAVLANALLRMGDERGVNFLNSLAIRAQGRWSVFAATALYIANYSDAGLRLLLHILENGDNEAKQRMVNQICYNWIHSPHAFTGEGIHEARRWVQGKLKSPNKYPIPLT
ncbi:MAG TPA: HEAT repeat domain-containing protein [Pirellulales bacterium]|nr:HEAT repeat domain-containing protein [Pirellulales bacterium]